MSLGLHLRYQCFETTMGFVDITCQIRKIRVQIHFRTGKPSVAPIATDLKQFHPAFFEFSRYRRHRRLASTEVYLHTDLSDLARDVNKAHRRLETLIAQVEAEAHDRI